MRTLEAADVIAGPVYDIKRVFNDPHYADREAIVGVADPDLGEMHMQGVIPKFSRTPGAIRHTGGAIGERSRAFYCDEVGLDADEWEALRADGVI